MRHTLPLHHLIVAQFLLVMLSITALFVLLVLPRLEQQVEGHAREDFAVVMDHAIDEIDEVFSRYLRYLDATAEMVSTSWAKDPHQLGDAQALARSLAPTGAPTAVLLARPSADFMIVITEGGKVPLDNGFSVTEIRTSRVGVRSRLDIRYSAEGTLKSRTESTTDHDPTKLTWYGDALGNTRPHLIPSNQIGSQGVFGPTLSRSVPGNAGVVAVRMGNFAYAIDELNLPENSIAVVMDAAGNVLAIRADGDIWSGLSKLPKRNGNLADPAFASLHTAYMTARDARHGVSHTVDIRGETHLVELDDVVPLTGVRYQVLLLAPISDFTGPVDLAKREAFLVCLVMLLLVSPFIWFGARRVSSALRDVAEDSLRMQALDFSPPEKPTNSFVHEVNVIAQAHGVVRESVARSTDDLTRTRLRLESLVSTGSKLILEHDRSRLLGMIVQSAKEVTDCDAVLIYVRDDNDWLNPVAEAGVPRFHDLPAYRMTSLDDPECTLAVHTAATGAASVIDDFVSDERAELRNCRLLYARLGLNAQTALSVPLKRPDGYVLGVLQLFNARDSAKRVKTFSGQAKAIAEALAAQTAVALDNNQLIASQQQVMDSLVLMLARAVDAKSPHTGAHCQRVPELAIMLAESAHRSEDPAFADFRFDRPEQWQEFRVGAWLHDCGKLTTPEHIIDKATKLETVYNRVHELRTRFEVALRDEKIDLLQEVIAGARTASDAEAEYEVRRAGLTADFAFVAERNIGGENLSAECVARLESIASRPWQRNFDDRLGLSIAEQKMRVGIDEDVSLPVTETIIADKAWHVVPWRDGEREAVSEGFSMAVPEQRYNSGELYNLCIPRGTLTTEERFKINEHVIQTIRMLEGMPFPKNLRRVAEYAGTHHEALNGKGYPRNLTAEQLSIPARIMAIADIFEALTASDRPYRESKTVSEALDILRQMSAGGHIDGDLLRLFIEDGTYIRYSQRFLKEEQIDTVAGDVLFGLERAVSKADPARAVAAS